MRYVTGGEKTANGSYIRKTESATMTIYGVTRIYTRDYYTKYSSDIEENGRTCFEGEVDGGYSNWN